MDLSREDQLYDEQWDVVDTFYNTNGPKAFSAVVTPEEANALKSYYFINSQEQDVYEYRKQIAIDDPELVRIALAAARKIAKADGLTDEEIVQLFV